MAKIQGLKSPIILFWWWCIVMVKQVWGVWGVWGEIKKYISSPLRLQDYHNF
ncbi:MAG: hypothetical protein WBA93_18040 [Microcoleaceae cyanobacterium]